MDIKKKYVIELSFLPKYIFKDKKVAELVSLNLHPKIALTTLVI